MSTCIIKVHTQNTTSVWSHSSCLLCPLSLSTVLGKLQIFLSAPFSLPEPTKGAVWENTYPKLISSTPSPWYNHWSTFGHEHKLSAARPGCRGDNHWATKVLGHSPATSQKTSGDTHSSHGPGMKPPCRRLSQSTALRLTFSSSALGSQENKTRGHFWQVREGQRKGRKSCHTTALVRNSIALFVQVSDFIRLCHSVNIVYGPILSVNHPLPETLPPPQIINSTIYRTEPVK